MSAKITFILGLVLIGFAGWQLRGGFASLKKEKVFIASSHTVTGIVTGYALIQESPWYRSAPQTRYAPILQFILPNGQLIRGQSDVKLKTQPYQVTSHQTVLYDPTNPQHANIKQDIEAHHDATYVINLGWWLLGAGVFWEIIALIIPYARRRSVTG